MGTVQISVCAVAIDRKIRIVVFRIPTTGDAQGTVIDGNPNRIDEASLFKRERYSHIHERGSERNFASFPIPVPIKLDSPVKLIRGRGIIIVVLEVDT